MKKILHNLSMAFLGLLLLFCLPTLVLADNEYRIPEAEFEVKINEDGSAGIHERWTVEFIYGTFTRFYKDISYHDLPKDEKFSEITDVSVQISGKECEPTSDTSGRPEYHYNLSSILPGATLAAYVKSEKVTRTFDFYYTVKDCVKYVDDSYHLFVFRFIGANFSKMVGEVKVHVTAPEGASMNILYCTAGEGSINKNEASVSCKNASGMYKLRLRMDGATIPGAVKISSSDLSNKKDQPLINTEMIIIIIFLIPVLAIIIAFIREKKMYDLLKNEGRVPIYKTVSELGKVLDPTELVSMVDPAGWLFPLHLSYMVSRGLIIKRVGKDNHVLLTLPSDYQQRKVSPADAYVYSVIQKSINKKYLTVALDKLTDDVTSEKEAHGINATLRSELRKQVKEKPQADTREFKKKLRWLRHAANVAKGTKLLPAISSEELFNSYISHINALYYQMNQFHPVSDHDMDGGYYYWDNLVSKNENSHIQYMNSTSRSEGGSACFSCSSCGGGGAD